MVLYKELSYQVMGMVYKVHRTLGPGLLENPYHNALFYELRKQGFLVQSEVPFPVQYDGQVVGKYLADLVVENKIIIEIKSVKALSPEMEAQIVNYLKVSGLQLGLLVNFHGVRCTFRRLVNSPP